MLRGEPFLGWMPLDALDRGVKMRVVVDEDFPAPFTPRGGQSAAISHMTV
jgi:hypothetical protein